MGDEEVGLDGLGWMMFMARMMAYMGFMDGLAWCFGLLRHWI
jgi:hypothetical protein